MKFTRTIKLTRIRREVLIPVTSGSRCPHCGGELDGSAHPSMVVAPEGKLIQTTEPGKSEETK